jgi:diaminopropionate ammonia-lyase
VELGETGVAAFAGLLAASAQPQARQLLGLDSESRVIAIGCEGVTDPTIYRQLIEGSGRVSSLAGSPLVAPEANPQAG